MAAPVEVVATWGERAGKVSCYVATASRTVRNLSHALSPLPWRPNRCVFDAGKASTAYALCTADATALLLLSIVCNLNARRWRPQRRVTCRASNKLLKGNAYALQVLCKLIYQGAWHEAKLSSCNINSAGGSLTGKARESHRRYHSPTRPSWQIRAGQRGHRR